MSRRESSCVVVVDLRTNTVTNTNTNSNTKRRQRRQRGRNDVFVALRWFWFGLVLVWFGLVWFGLVWEDVDTVLVEILMESCARVGLLACYLVQGFRSDFRGWLVAD